MSINICPNEILKIILDSLTRTDAYQCSLVCRRWSPIATAAMWRDIYFKIDPSQNRFADLLHQSRQEIFTNFQYTKRLEFYLSFESELRCCTAVFVMNWVRNTELLKQICAGMPQRLTELKITYGRIANLNADLRNIFSSVVAALLELARKVTGDVHYLQYHELRTLEELRMIRHNVASFNNSLTRLSINLRDWLVVLPVMPRLTHCDLKILSEGWSTNDKSARFVNALTTSPLVQLSLTGFSLAYEICIPGTITSLSLVDMTATWAVLLMPFFYLRNLLSLRLTVPRRHRARNALPSILREKPIVATELQEFVLGWCWIPLWFFRRIGESCRKIKVMRLDDPRKLHNFGTGPLIDHFQLKFKKTSVTSTELGFTTDSVWGSLFKGFGGSHLIFYCKGSSQDYDKSKLQWQLQKLVDPPSVEGDIAELNISENSRIDITTLTDEETTVLGLSNIWEKARIKAFPEPSVPSITNCQYNNVWELRNFPINLS